MCEAINENIRSKYELVYHPTNAKQDGTWRKIRVELVDDEGNPLRMQDEKHKPLKYDIIAETATAPSRKWSRRSEPVSECGSSGGNLRPHAVTPVTLSRIPSATMMNT